jgi:hypothetical protein
MGLDLVCNQVSTGYGRARGFPGLSIRVGCGRLVNVLPVEKKKSAILIITAFLYCLAGAFFIFY